MKKFFFTILGAFYVAANVWALDSNELPSGSTINAGEATIGVNGNRLDVVQQSARLSIDWDSFNIGKDAAVVFDQPSSSAIALNRIHDVNPSQIMGSLSANGKIFLINSAGIIFGSGAQVDVGGLVASSLNIGDEDFLTGKFSFSGSNFAGAVLNQGRIQTAQGGYVAFLSPAVSNEGTIVTPQGAVLLAAGSRVNLDFSGDGILNYTVEQGALDALAHNHGLIKADGGLVVMTAKAADALSKAVVNNDGIIEAHTVAEKNGRILLLSDMDYGETVVGGTLDASAPDGGNGGFIETSGHKVTLNGAHITAAAPYGKAGTWLLDPTNLTIDSTYVNGTSSTTTILDPTTAFVAGWSGWASSTGAIANSFGGGNPWIDTSENWLRFAYVDNSYVYKDFTLSGSETSITFSAQYDGFGSGSSPNDTGKIQLIFLNSSNAQVGSTIESGTLTGSGSFQTASITASSIPSGAAKVRVQFYQINEVNGWADHYGMIFNDPTVEGLGTSGGILATLNGGTDVTAQTSALGSDAGDITVSAAIATTGTGAGALTLIAHNDIYVNENITLTGTGKNLTLQAGGDVFLSSALATIANITINAGAAEAAGTSSGGNIIVSGASVTAGAGGVAVLYSGSVLGSTGLTALIGSGSGNFRYNSDESADNFSTALSTGAYAIYREQPALNITADNENKTYDGLTYSGGNGVSLSGLVNGDTQGMALGGSVAYGGSSQGAVNDGTYVITPSGYTSLLGYALSYTSGVLTISGQPEPVLAPANNDDIDTVVRSLTSLQYGVNGTHNSSNVSSSGTLTGFYFMGPGAGSGSLARLSAFELIIDRQKNFI